MLRDHDSAADCVQDTFCTVATTLRNLREPDKLRPWLYSIARNEASEDFETAAANRCPTTYPMPRRATRVQGSRPLETHRPVPTAEPTFVPPNCTPRRVSLQCLFFQRERMPARGVADLADPEPATQGCGGTR